MKSSKAQIHAKFHKIPELLYPDAFVVDGLQREQFPRLTLDFDGSVLSTKGHAEGSAIGFNKKKKGTRSYYPLFCTTSQTGQFLTCTIDQAMFMILMEHQIS